jgi:proline iminopeptidase
MLKIISENIANMADSKKIAGLIGPTSIVLTLSEMMNFHIWSTSIPQVIYLNGIILFVVGLSIIRVHNSWRGWPAMVTMAGWFAIIGGLYRVFFPEAQQAPQNIYTYIMLTVLFAVGVLLTYNAYKPEDNKIAKRKYFLIFFLSLITIFQLALLFIHKKVPQTVEFDNSLPYTEINGYKYHMEIFGAEDSTPIIVVHGGPGLDYEYLKPLKQLSDSYRVIFYDQRGTGLSPRVDKRFLTIEQNLDDLHSIAQYFSKGRKVKLIGHSWGATLVVGYLSKHPEMVSQAVIVEPFILYPGAPVKEWVEKSKRMMSNMASTWQIAKSMAYYPFVIKEDGQEGYEYIGTKLSGKNLPGPPYNCEGQDLPPNSFKRMGFAAYNTILKPIIDNPNSLKYDFTNGIIAYHGDLMLMSGECSILGPAYQEKYAIPKLPPQTFHVKAMNMGHHMITLNTEWTLQTIRKFFK